MVRPEKKAWYVIYTKARREEFAQFHLKLKGIETFFPRLLLPRSREKRNPIVPLFPNYIFVRIALSSEYHYVLWSPGVKYLVGLSGDPMPLQDDVVDLLMNQTNIDGTITAHSTVKIGQEVRICGGPLAGLVGIIQNPPNAKGRVTLLLNLLKRQVEAQAPLECLEVGWVA